MMKKSILFSMVLLSPFAGAAELVSFEQGGTAKASEVNGNFEALNAEIQGNTAAISNVALTPGPAGAAGATGPIGPGGGVGAAGAAGADGVAGPAGANGVAGPAGLAGADGVAGPAGAAGVAGADGADGLDGAAGPAGQSGVAFFAEETIAVDCDAGGSIQSALDSASVGMVTINVTGTCEENLQISRSNIIIDGGDTTEVVLSASPGIYIFGASNIDINNLIVTGGANSSLVMDDAQVSLTNTDITSTSHSDFAAMIDHSKLRISGSSIVHANAQDESGGLLVWNNSTLILDGGNVIRTDGFDAIALDVVQSSAVTKSFSATTSDSVISSGVDGIGILLEGASSAAFIPLSGVSITGLVDVIGSSYLLADAMNANDGLAIGLNSSVQVEGTCASTCTVNIAGDVEFYKGSRLQGEGVNFSGGTIHISESSEIEVFDSAVGSNIRAFGSFKATGGTVSGDINCPFGGAGNGYRQNVNLQTLTFSGIVTGGPDTDQSCVLGPAGPINFN